MKNRFVCQMCHASYTNRQNLQGHLFRHHGIGAAKKCTCGKEFAWASEYCLHRKNECPDVKKPTEERTKL